MEINWLATSGRCLVDEVTLIVGDEAYFLNVGTTKDGTPLEEEARVSLIRVATNFEINDTAKQFLDDALEDHPDSEQLKKLQ